VAFRAFAEAEAGADLVDARGTGGEETFEVQFWRGAEPATGGGYGIDMVFECWSGETQGSLCFEEVAAGKESAERAQKAAPQLKDPKVFRITSF
jgi:hypothetical protein